MSQSKKIFIFTINKKSDFSQDFSRMPVLHARLRSSHGVLMINFAVRTSANANNTLAPKIYAPALN